jgi:hypothetical protein
MKTRKHHFQSHNSPWTETFALHCAREDADANQAMGSKADQEQQPTHEALADVYNRQS